MSHGSPPLRRVARPSRRPSVLSLGYCLVMPEPGAIRDCQPRCFRWRMAEQHTLATLSNQERVTTRRCAPLVCDRLGFRETASPRYARPPASFGRDAAQAHISPAIPSFQIFSNRSARVRYTRPSKRIALPFRMPGATSGLNPASAKSFIQRWGLPRTSALLGSAVGDRSGRPARHRQRRGNGYHLSERIRDSQ